MPDKIPLKALYTGNQPTALGEFNDGDTLPISHGGTGKTTAEEARANLGLTLGSQVQAYDADLAALAGLSGTGLIERTGAGTAGTVTVTVAGKAILDDADAATQRTTLGLKGAATLDVGTAADTVAAGNHTHPGVYEPADATILKSAAIGSTVQGYDADLAAVAGLSTTGLIERTGAGTAGTVTVTVAGKAILDDADAATQRTTLGVGTGDSPQFAEVNLGHASDTTLARSAAGQVTIEGVAITTASNSQALSNKELTGTQETVHSIVDGATVDINPAQGGIQTWTLGANRTPTATNFAAGQSVMLMINDGTAYAVNWTGIGVVWVGGTEPTLPTSGYGIIELWKVGATVYGASVGNVA